MANETKQVSIPETSREQGVKLSEEFQDAGLGSLTHGSIYDAGLEAKRALLARIKAASGKK